MFNPHIKYIGPWCFLLTMTFGQWCSAWAQAMCNWTYWDDHITIWSRFVSIKVLRTFESHPNVAPWTTEIELCVATGLQEQCQDILDHAHNHALIRYHPIPVSSSYTTNYLKLRIMWGFEWSLSLDSLSPHQSGLCIKFYRSCNIDHCMPCRFVLTIKLSTLL